MTPYQKRILSPITLRMAGDMRVRNLAPRTIDTYTYHVERFAKHFGKPLDVLGPEEIREYQLHLIEVQGKTPRGVALTKRFVGYASSITLRSPGPGSCSTSRSASAPEGCRRCSAPRKSVG